LFLEIKLISMITVDLTHLISLQTLSFTRLRYYGSSSSSLPPSHHDEYTPPYALTSPSLLLTLSQLHSPSLTHISFHLTIPSTIDPYEDTLPIDWARVSHLLGRRELCGLEAVRIEGQGMPVEYERKFAALVRSKRIERQMEGYGLRMPGTADISGVDEADGGPFGTTRASRRRSFFETAQVDELDFMG
jgi:hypothetical protein